MPDAGSSDPDDYHDGVGEGMLPLVTRIRDLYGKDASNNWKVGVVPNRDASWKDPLGVAPPSPASDYPSVRTTGYPAIGWFPGDPTSIKPYVNSVRSGTAQAASDLGVIHTRCPSSKLLVIGYSEGAEVTRRALASLSWHPAAGSVVTLVFGDVLWKTADPHVKYVGDTATNEHGVIREANAGNIALADLVIQEDLPAAIDDPPDFPDNWNITSYCHGGDIACQWPGGTLDAHLTYDEQDAYGAAARAAFQLGGPWTDAVPAAFLSTDASCFPGGLTTVSVAMSVAGSPSGTSLTFNGVWEPLGNTAYSPVTLTSSAPTASRSFTAGAMVRFVVTVDAHKIEYRNTC